MSHGFSQGKLPMNCGSVLQMVIPPSFFHLGNTKSRCKQIGNPNYVQWKVMEKSSIIKITRLFFFRHLTSFDPILSRDCNAPRKSPWEVEWVEVQFICSPKRRDFERIRLSCAMSYMCCMCQMSKFFAFKCLKFEPKLFRSNLWVIECQLLI